MPHLLTTYSKTSGLRIEKMQVTQSFFPLPFEDKYVIIIVSTGAQAKNYPYYRLVTQFLKPILNKNGYKLVQLGMTGDEKLGVDLDLCGATNLYQYAWLINHSELVLCGDTSAIHLCGHFSKKFVSLFSTSHPKISGAFYGNPEDQIYLFPDQWKPNYIVQEEPRQIAKIKPEIVIETVCKSLNLEFDKFTSLYFGPFCNFTCVDIIPDSLAPAQFLPNILLTIRYDKGGEENIVYEQLRHRKCVVVTDKILNVDILAQLRSNIEALVFLVGEKDEFQFIKDCQRAGVPLRLITYISEEDFTPRKLDYIDYPLVEYKKLISEAPSELKDKDNLIFRTNKRILSGGKVFLSYAHKALQKNIENLEIDSDNLIDSNSFYEDLENYYIYQNKNS